MIVSVIFVVIVIMQRSEDFIDAMGAQEIVPDDCDREVIVMSNWSREVSFLRPALMILRWTGPGSQAGANLSHHY